MSTRGIGDQVRFADQRFVMWKALPGWASRFVTTTVPYVKVERRSEFHRLS